MDAWCKNAGKPRREHTSQAVSKQLPWLAMTEKAGPLKKGKESVQARCVARLKLHLGGGFKYVLFSPLFGEMIQFD